MASQHLCVLEGRQLIIMSYLKTVVPNVFAVPYQQCMWPSWITAACAPGSGAAGHCGVVVVSRAAGHALLRVNSWGEEEVWLPVGAVALAAGAPVPHCSWT